MGNSGFFNNGTNSVVYADNINFSGETTTPAVTEDGQLLIGASTSPNIRPGHITGTDGIVVNNSPGGINLTFDISKANPELIARNVQLVKTSDIISCYDVFTASNVNTVTSGTEILKMNVTPTRESITLIIEANILVSRREGQFGLLLVQEGVDTPLSFSVGFSSGYPNMCTLKCFLTPGNKEAVKLSLRIGGINSGPVVVNGMPNGTALLTDSTKSTNKLESFLMVTEGILSSQTLTLQ